MWVSINYITGVLTIKLFNNSISFILHKNVFTTDNLLSLKIDVCN